ncbi:MAG: hypothetical protein A3H42_02435, partial [Deltaproteobacteria bacterium RIFCSPLOWO2_02_FULL_46_8]
MLLATPCCAIDSRMQNAPQIITKVYDFLIYLIPQIEKFPRSQRYLLGERVETISFDVLEILLEACYSQTKLPLLKQANVKLEKIRYYVRLCKDLKLISLHGYEVISQKVNEIGVQL